MMWYRHDADAHGHPKFAELDAVLSEPRTGWYWEGLLAWCCRYAARAVFAPGAVPSVESACGWRGQPGALVAAFVQVGLVDRHPDGTFEVHDWWEKQGKAIEKAERDAATKRQKREEQAATRRENRAKPARAASAPKRRQTVRDGTVHNYSPPLPLSPADEPPADTEQEGLREALPEAAQQPRHATFAPESTSGTEDEAVTHAVAFAAVWCQWAQNNGGVEAAGQSAHAWAAYQFQKHSYDAATRARLTTHLKLAWADFVAWCAANDKRPGWGLWLEEKVGAVRLDEARAGVLPRKPNAQQAAMPLGPLNAVGVKR